METVILVDVNDNAIGTMEKMEAHYKGVLHRAFSILIFNTKGEMLIQKRADTKYHSAGLWTNACCSHPKPGEPLEVSAKERLKHEMGVDANVAFSHKFIYRTELNDDLVEHELDHVFIGTFDGQPKINPEEVADWKYVNFQDLRKDVQMNPQNYTPWFRLILNHSAISELA